MTSAWERQILSDKKNLNQKYHNEDLVSELTPAGSRGVCLQSQERQPQRSESEAGKLF